ncbi:MAG: hypothetical protein KA789_03555 [Parabacteroides sp.]|nr:hypothetical protein [Parabacteroides sp.]
MRISLTLLFLFIFVFITASDYTRISNTRSLGMGGAGVTHSFSFNPALTALSTNKQIGVDIYNRFSVNGLNTMQTSFCYPNPLLSGGIHLASFGNDLYRENLFIIAVAKQVSEKVTLGISTNCRFLQSDLLETAPIRLAVDAGVVIKPVDKLLIGISLLDFPSVNLSVTDKQLEQTPVYNLRAGFNWEFVPLCLLTAELVSSAEKSVAVNMGVEYSPYTSFQLRAGLQGNPFMPACGIGYEFSKFTLQMAAQFHPLLGTSTGLGIQAHF